MSILEKTKVIAIAKDEAAYIPEWIFHHLYFGFDAIEILINRTTDNSESVLSKISSKFPNVSFSSCDWIDLGPDAVQRNFQQIAYAYAYKKAIDDGFSRILFIDIDELWTPRDFTTKISEYIQLLPSSASISFNWLIELGVSKEFESIQENLTFTLNDHLKTLIHKSSKIKKMEVHVPKFEERTLHLMANGEEFTPSSNPQFHKEKISRINNAFIIHRMYRSEMEYLSCLYRGNPESKTFKRNRNGFITKAQNMQKISFPQNELAKYKHDFYCFIQKCNLGNDLKIAEKEIINRANACINSAKRLIGEDNHLAKKIFNGCRNPHILDILQTDTRRLLHHIDYIVREEGKIIITGWMFAPYARAPLCIETNHQTSNIISCTRLNRPDVVKVHPEANLDSGFKLEVKYSPITPPTTLTLEAKEKNLIKTHHGTFVHYDTVDEILCHDKVNSIRKDTPLLPVFFIKIQDKEVLAIYQQKRILTICIDDQGKIIFKSLDQIKENDNLFKKEGENTTFSILLEKKFVCAAPGGNFSFDRKTANQWELFSLHFSPEFIYEQLIIKL